VVGVLVYLDFLNVKVLTPAFEGGYLDFEGLSGGPRRGGASARVGPGMTGWWGDGDGGFIKFTEGSVEGWGCGDAAFRFNKTGEEMSEVLGGGFPAGVDRGVGDGQEIDILVVGVVWVRIVIQAELLAFLDSIFRERGWDRGVSRS